MKINKKLIKPTIAMIIIGLFLAWFGFNLTGAVLIGYAIVLNLL